MSPEQWVQQKILQLAEKPIESCWPTSTWDDDGVPTLAEDLRKAMAAMDSLAATTWVMVATHMLEGQALKVNTETLAGVDGLGLPPLVHRRDTVIWLSRADFSRLKDHPDCRWDDALDIPTGTFWWNPLSGDVQMMNRRMHENQKSQ